MAVEESRMGESEAGTWERQVLALATTVIIPARNEEVAIFDIVRTFGAHPATHEIYVGIDGATVDRTAQRVVDAGGIPIPFRNVHGKGQVVSHTVAALLAAGFLTERVILCDGDYTGLTTDHITAIRKPYTGMVVGIPDPPDIEVPEHVTDAWPKVSGFRCLPWGMIPQSAHGYLLETQLEIIAGKLRMPIQRVNLPGLKAPFQWPLSPRRMAALKADRAWGEEHGIL
jgi:hypothetical protein